MTSPTHDPVAIRSEPPRDYEQAISLRQQLIPERHDFDARIKRVVPRALRELIAEFTTLLEKRRK